MMNSLAARAAPQARVFRGTLFFFQKTLGKMSYDDVTLSAAGRCHHWVLVAVLCCLDWKRRKARRLTDRNVIRRWTLFGEYGLKSVLFWWFVNLCFSDLTRRFVDRGLLPGSLFGSTGPARGIRNRNGDPGDTGNLRRSHTQLHQNRALEASTTTGALEMHVFHFNMFHFF